ncbi:MAG: carbohydrate ABC transporter substrate-binding protein [Devosia nanyangense]|uniref:Probable sugar-binding periplasmic protein n=1 Tax=Devosia nanyangense TaxID=1228055 RepID=A0A933L512_9HYPH|nr:carbohydrate ABC transporter substrate-binding protein [Devosia nanyangense]
MRSVFIGVVFALSIVVLSSPASAADCEVVHSWTSPEEVAGEAVLAEAFNAGGDHWEGVRVDANELQTQVIRQIASGNAPCAALLSPATIATLAASGLLRDLRDLASQGSWANFLEASALDGCTVDGHILCVPVSLRTEQWMWLNRDVYQQAGMNVPQSWTEFVASVDSVRASGKLPLAVAEGWPVGNLLDGIEVAVAGTANYLSVYRGRDTNVAGGPDYRDVWTQFDVARRLVEPGQRIARWDEAVDLVVQGQAAANVTGDWALARFEAAGKTPGVDFDCLPGLGQNPALHVVAETLAFPVSQDPEIVHAQEALAAVLVRDDVQREFNARRGTLPARLGGGDGADVCVQRGVALIQNGATYPSRDELLDGDSLRQIRDLETQFFADTNMSIDEAQARLVDIIQNAPPP